jgi:hypothetical protein
MDMHELEMVIVPVGVGESWFSPLLSRVLTGTARRNVGVQSQTCSRGPVVASLITEAFHALGLVSTLAWVAYESG